MELGVSLQHSEYYAEYIPLQFRQIRDWLQTYFGNKVELTHALGNADTVLNNEETLLPTVSLGSATTLYRRFVIPSIAALQIVWRHKSNGSTSGS